MSKDPGRPVSLKELAKLLALSPSTVSRIVNGHGSTFRIAEETQQRVLHAAALHGYTANALAQNLRRQRSFTIGVIVPEISEGYSTGVLSGMEDELLKAGYFYFVVSHRHRSDLLDEYTRMLLARSVEGLIAIDTPLEQELPIPVVAVSGPRRIRRGTRIALDHHRAARLALSHLQELGHRHIAFMKGQPLSSDTKKRWASIVDVAGELEIPVDPRLVVQLEGTGAGSGPGHAATRALIASGARFTALFAFNDLSAIGAIQALRENGIRTPRDVSVLGFDDVTAACTHRPPLTTIRQPLAEMGKQAAIALLSLIHGGVGHTGPTLIRVHPELIIRESTARRSETQFDDTGE